MNDCDITEGCLGELIPVFFILSFLEHGGGLPEAHEQLTLRACWAHTFRQHGLALKADRLDTERGMIAEAINQSSHELLSSAFAPVGVEA